MCALREEKQRNVSNASEASETFVPHGPIGLRKAKKCRMSNNWNSNKWNLTMPSFRQVFLPYALLRLGDGWFLPVNRQYKPLGQSKIKIKGLTDAKAEKLGLQIGGIPIICMTTPPILRLPLRTGVGMRQSWPR